MHPKLPSFVLCVVVATPLLWNLLKKKKPPTSNQSPQSSSFISNLVLLASPPSFGNSLVVFPKPQRLPEQLLVSACSPFNPLYRFSRKWLLHQVFPQTRTTFHYEFFNVTQGTLPGLLTTCPSSSQHSLTHILSSSLTKLILVSSSGWTLVTW